MQKQAAGGTQHAVDLDEPLCHAHQIRQQAALPDHRLQPGKQTRQFGRMAKERIVTGLRRIVPGPGIGEAMRLRARLIVAARVERRVDVAKIDGFVGNLGLQHLQIVTAK
jgi:hypothetical protein